MVSSQKKTVDQRFNLKPGRHQSRKDFVAEGSGSLLEQFELKELYLRNKEMEELEDYVTVAMKRKRR